MRNSTGRQGFSPKGLALGVVNTGYNWNRRLKRSLRNRDESELRWKNNSQPWLICGSKFLLFGERKIQSLWALTSHKLFYMEVDILVCSHSWTPCSQVHPPKAWASHCLWKGVLSALILMLLPALLHQALHFFKQSPMFSWTLVLPLLSLPNPKPRKAPGAPLSESWQIGSVCCVLRKVTSFRLMKQWQFQSA